MTEITDKKGGRRPADRFIVDPVAFALSMVAGPVFVGLLGAPLLLVPSFAVVFGGVPYLLFGTPALLIYLRFRSPSCGEIALLAFLVNILLFALVALVAAQVHPLRYDDFLFFMFGFGCVFAPIWGATTAWLYRRWRRPFYVRSHPL